MVSHEATPIAERLSRMRIAVVGDFALDAYWEIDPDDQELSLETGKPTHCVTAQRYSLGGAGNCVRHAAALRTSVTPVGVIGADLYGSEMLRLFRAIEVDVSHLVVSDRWTTPVYAKPLLQGIEQERYDFGRRNTLCADTEDALLRILRTLAPQLDGVIINQQLVNGLVTASLVGQLNDIAAQHSRTVFVLNSRQMTHLFRNMYCWLNTAEATRACSTNGSETTNDATADQVLEWAQQLYALLGRPVVITQGRRGLAGYDGTPHLVPGITVPGTTDPTGAGDAGVTVFTLALCAGFRFDEAMQLANRAAASTVRSLNDTGTVKSADLLLPENDGR